MGKESLITFQNILCKLYTEEEIRDDFVNNKVEFVNRLNLDLAEKELLKGIANHELMRYADSLIYKRRSISKKIIPELYSIPEMETAFYTFSKRTPLQGNEKYTNDSLMFLKELKPNSKLEKELIRLLKHRLQKHLKKNYFYLNIYQLDLDNLRDYVTGEFVICNHLQLDIKFFSYHFSSTLISF